MCQSLFHNVVLTITRETDGSQDITFLFWYKIQEVIENMVITPSITEWWVSRSISDLEYLANVMISLGYNIIRRQ